MTIADPISIVQKAVMRGELEKLALRHFCGRELKARKLWWCRYAAVLVLVGRIVIEGASDAT